MRAIGRVSMTLVVVAATASCGLKADRVDAVAAPATASTPAAASPAAAPEPSPPAEPEPVPASPEPARPAAAAPSPPPSTPPSATRPASEPCAPLPPAAAAYGLQAAVTFPTSVVKSSTEGTLTVRNVGTQTVHVSGRSYAGAETVEGEFLTSTSASTSDYVAPVELRPGEQRSYRVHLVGQPCSGGRPDFDGRLASGRHTVVGLLQVQEAPGLSVTTRPVDVQYEAG